MQLGGVGEGPIINIPAPIRRATVSTNQNDAMDIDDIPEQIPTEKKSCEMETQTDFWDGDHTLPTKDPFNFECQFHTMNEKATQIDAQMPFDLEKAAAKVCILRLLLICSKNNFREREAFLLITFVTLVLNCFQLDIIHDNGFFHEGLIV